MAPPLQARTLHLPQVRKDVKERTPIFVRVWIGDATKPCASCKRVLPRAAFSCGRARCRDCRAEEGRVSYAANLERERERTGAAHLRSYAADPERAKAKAASYAANPEPQKARTKKWKAANPKRVQASAAKYQAAHLERVRARRAGWKAANPKRVRAADAKWRAANRGKVNALDALREARKRQAAPKWLTKAQLAEMRLFYVNRPPGHHVDHIHPLAGVGLCGLHVPWNLQYLTAAENTRKGNRWPSSSPALGSS